jgi:hypothetical protein
MIMREALGFFSAKLDDVLRGFGEVIEYPVSGSSLEETCEEIGKFKKARESKVPETAGFPKAASNDPKIGRALRAKMLLHAPAVEYSCDMYGGLSFFTVLTKHKA